MAEEHWLLDETRPIEAPDESRLTREFRRSRRRGAAPAPTPNLVLSLHDVVIHDTKKWFGDADIRLDMLVATGRRLTEEDPSFFVPKTETFPGVRDGDALPIGDGGLIGFYGVPAHFLDLSIIVSRDTKDVDTLAALLQNSKDAEVTNAIGKVTELIAAPHVAAVKAAWEAASTLGNVAYKLLRALTGSTIGLYRNSHLQYRDGFGIGRHPEEGTFRRNDLSFRYEITLEAEPG